jgi:large subunit ribosomal protein L9
LREVEGLRAQSVKYERHTTVQSFTASPVTTLRGPRTSIITANKKAVKRRQVILTADVEHLGKEGELHFVKPGYFRNYLYPYQMARIATPDIIAAIEAEKAAEEEEKRRVRDAAFQVAQSLQLVGMFVVQKKAGDNKQIFGGVSTGDVAEAIRKQTLRDIPKGDITVPEIKALGVYSATIKLHPEVTATIKINVVPGK